MKFTKTLLASILLTAFAVTPVLRAEDAKEKAKPYPLKKCIVSDEDIGGGDMKPYTWVYKGQEIKMCCKDCKKDFMKEPEKYMKKIEEANKAKK